MGLILKLNEEHQIVGVTTVATILALVALVVLAVFGRLERAFLPRPSNHQATVDDREP